MENNNKILLIVDQPDIRRLLDESLNGFQYLFLSAEEDPTQRVFDEMPHLIVIDEDYHERQGLAIALKIKEDLVLKYIPIILLTGSDTAESTLLDKRVDLCCNISQSSQNLIQRVQEMLDKNYNELDLNPLTRLPGSRSSLLRIEHAIRDKKLFAVCCVDLSDLSAYNSAYGDARGDEIIISLAKTIEDVLKSHGGADDFLGHLGGDDFLIVTSYDSAVRISESIIYNFDAEIHKFYESEDKKQGYILQRNSKGFLMHYPIMSCSVVILHDENQPLTEISEIGRIVSELKKYTKTITGSCYIKYRHRPQMPPDLKPGESLEVRFPNKMKSVIVPNAAPETDKYSVFFNEILKARKIETAYQPIVDLRGRQVIGYEALTRSRADNFTTEPALLFSIARESGKIKELDQLCVEVALMSGQKLGPDKKLFINLNLETLIDPKIMKEIFSKKNVIDYHNIVIELTEQSILRAFENVRDALFELKEKGVSVAIDDVGGGAVSLRDVAILKPDYMKFDRSLIRQIDSNSTKQQIVLSLILFANGIKAVTTAEGIETKEEYQTVQGLGVSLAQGYYFARPGKPFPEIIDF